MKGLAFLLMLLVVSSGCSGPVSRYLKSRGLDLWDCVPISVSKGLGGGVFGKVTPFVTPALGAYDSTAYGMASRRWGGSWGEAGIGFLLMSGWGDQYEREREDIVFPSRFPGGPDVRYNEGNVPNGTYFSRNVMNILMVFPMETHEVVRETPSWHSWLSAEAAVFIGVVGIRVGVCPDQVFDFFAGLFGFDPFGDDIDGERESEFREKYEKAPSSNKGTAPAPSGT